MQACYVYSLMELTVMCVNCGNKREDELDAPMMKE
jgi:hypothetical protein